MLPILILFIHFGCIFGNINFFQSWQRILKGFVDHSLGISALQNLEYSKPIACYKILFAILFLIIHYGDY